MIYLIADTHFFHLNIIQYCDRPFKNVDEMNGLMIKNWNNVVKEDDIVIHFGDVGFGMVETLSPIIKSLNGHKILIRGNHDRKRGVNSWENIGFDIVVKNKKIYQGELADKIGVLIEKYGLEPLAAQGFHEPKNFETVIFSHEPVQCDDNVLNLHGHIHNVKLNPDLNPNNHVCVSVELINYTPVLLQDILTNY